ncbi:dihydrolipoyllysine-residue acetyltransferase component of pyruvate dehydrogenase complex [Arthrobacter sp. Hiyo1]|nr:dihydrolipoyllysine-residue acetyltransferase component of pyruvate dehydrogenase complex [Arthrobacter sp. Hiyo1]
MLHGEAGQTLDVGRPLISVAPVDASVAADPEPAVEKVPAAPSADAAAESYRTEEKAGSGNVLIGYGTSGSGEGRRTRPRKVSAGSAVAVTSEPDFAELSLSRTRIPGKLSAVISPLVRKMARDHGVSLDAVPGSGESGLILRRDIEAAIGGATRETAPVEVPAVVQPSTGVQDARTGLNVASRTPVRGIRKAVAANMTRSRSEIPEATVWVDVDATALLEMRAELKKRDPHGTPGLLAFIARFVTAGLKKFPELNTRFVTAEDTAGGEIQEVVAFDGINLGFAAQTDRGLVVPSVRNAHLLNARELNAEIRRLTAVARDGKATPTELASGTFTLNNYGVFGVDGSAAIINYPEVAMLGVGRIIDKPG